MTFGSITAGLTLILTATVTNIWQFYLFYGVMFGLATTVMGGMVIEPALIAKWFVRHRGRAMAVAMMGISAGGVVIAPWAGWLVDTIGWRAAWVALGITIFVLLTLPALIFVRRSPEDLGLKPDGVNDNDRESTSINVDSPNSDSYLEYPWTLREATRTKALWLLLCVHMFGGLAWRPIIIHQVAYIQDKGFGLGTATSVATAIAFFSMIAQLPWGYWTEKYSLKFLISSCGITSGLSVMILVMADNLMGLYLYALVHGLTQGGFPTLMNVAWASFFGRENSGTIRGSVFPPVIVVGFLSPAIAGWMWDRSESYGLAFICFAIAWIISGLIMLAITPPKPPIYLPN
jgi:MFS family permease